MVYGWKWITSELSWRFSEMLDWDPASHGRRFMIDNLSGTRTNRQARNWLIEGIQSHLCSFSGYKHRRLHQHSRPSPHLRRHEDRQSDSFLTGCLLTWLLIFIVFVLVFSLGFVSLGSRPVSTNNRSRRSDCLLRFSSSPSPYPTPMHLRLDARTSAHPLPRIQAGTRTH